MQKRKKKCLDHLLTPYTRINPKWIKDLNVSLKAIKIIEENIGSKVSDIPCSNILSDISPQARKTEVKINKWDYIKLKSFAQQRKSSTKLKDNPWNGTTYLPIHMIRD